MIQRLQKQLNFPAAELFRDMIFASSSLLFRAIGGYNGVYSKGGRSAWSANFSGPSNHVFSSFHPALAPPPKSSMICSQY